MRGLLILSILSLALGACASSEPPAEASPAAPQGTSCPSGKCDGLADTLQDYYDDMRALDLNDLTALGVGFATDKVNDALGVAPFVDISLGETAFFGDPDEVFGRVTVTDLKSLKAGLTEGLGEHAFATRVNALRAETLARTDAQVFAESSFKIRASEGLEWSMTAEALVGTVGFNGGGDLEAILIAPYAGNLEAVWQNPLALLQDLRGFILPRSIEDLKAMAPGESLALRGQGGLGFNLGVGMPIIIGTVLDYVTLHARVSAGARVSLKGTLDVQLVRGAEQLVYVDVGLSKVKLQHFSLGVKSGWGIEGLPEIDLDLGPVNVDLDDLMEKALSDQLNKKLTVFEGSASYGSEEGRLTVARFRFDLNHADEAVTQAIAQAMRADLRLAQALANRGAPGVVQELDLSKDHRSESTYFGFRFLSMRFFSSEASHSGAVHIEADGRHQALLFSELEESGGLFFNDHSSEWYTLTSLITQDGALIDAANNVRLTIREGDDYFTRDQLLDHVDSVLVWMLGLDAATRLSAVTDGILVWVDDFCPSPMAPGGDADEQDAAEAAYEACVAGMFAEDAYLQLKDEARDLYGDLAADLAFGDFDDAFAPAAEVARALFELKLGFSSVHHHPGFLQGPTGSVISQARFSQDALDGLFVEGAEPRFTQALEAVYAQLIADRDEPAKDKAEAVAKALSRQGAAIYALQDRFNSFSARYQQLQRVAALKFTGEAPLGESTQLMLVPVDRPMEATLSAVAQRKGALLEDFYPELVKLADKLKGVEESFIIAYTLLNMARPEHVELLLSYQFDEDAPEAYQALKTRIYTRGSADFISAGDFKLDQLLGF
ncbi:hypothetical protein KKB55_19755 [Myxococcota bacterium]|nr:hypothetical protein [Myxococcota bacterium]MBU1899984.1 hypothetical protein [Myxococcota bacterium]